MTRVAIVDDHPVYREGLAGLLATVPSIHIVGTAASAEQAIAALTDWAPDVVLMDLNMPGRSGIAATREMAALLPSAAVLVVTMVDDDDSVYAALAAGARGYLLKDATPTEIMAAVQTVAEGGAVFGAGVAGRLLTQAALRPERATSPSDIALTPREHQVLDLLAGGVSNKVIARNLGLSLKTVQNHVSRILDKLQVCDRTAAALRARGMPPRQH